MSEGHVRYMEYNKPKVSIVMPVYNAGKYLRGAIESVLNQTYKNFKLILVDDGATDGSGEICDNYSQIDSRIFVVHQKNQGICGARNTGLNYIDGEYTAFCDHDDYYEKSYLETAISAMENQKADLLKFNYITFLIHKGMQKASFLQSDGGCYNQEELLSNYSLLELCSKALWNGIYKTEIIIKYNVRFDPFFLSGVEDYDFNFKYLWHCKTICAIKDRLYVHYAREGQSTDLKFTENKVVSWIKVSERENIFLEKLADKLEYNIPEYTRIRQKNRYLISLFVCMLRKNDFSFYKKKRTLIYCSKKKPYCIKTGKNAHKKLYQYNCMQWVLVWLYEHKLYGTCLFYMWMKIRIGYVLKKRI